MKPVKMRHLLALALPAIASALLNNFYRVIDQFAVQWLGTPAQAAIGSSTFILIAFYALFMVVSAGTGPMIGRAVGAKDPNKITTIIGNSTLLMLITGLIYSLGLIFGAPLMAEWVGLSNNTATAFITYLETLGYFGLFIAFGPLIDSIFIAAGDTKTPMWLQLGSTMLNALLNYLLIYTLELGIAGAAMASGISRGVTSLMGFILIIRKYNISWQVNEIASKIIRVGAPMAGGTLMYALVYWGLLRWTISPLGPEVNAALGIGFSALEGVSWPLYAGVMMAVSSLIGRQLGANDLEGTKETIRLAVPMATGLGLSCALIFWFGSELLCGFFTPDGAVLKEAILYAQILAFSQVFVAYEATFEGILGGAGHNDYQLWLSVPLNIIRIPLAYLLALSMGFGAAGVWWAINITTIVKALGKGLLVRHGTWRHIKL